MHRAAVSGGTLRGAAAAGEGERWSEEAGAGTVGDTAVASRRVPAEGATGRTGGGGGATAGAAGTGDGCRNAGAGAGRTVWGGSNAEGGEEGEAVGAAAGWLAGTPLRCAAEGASAAGNTETGRGLAGDPSGGSDPGRSWEVGAGEAVRRWVGTWAGVGA